MATETIKYSITFLSDWHAGSGLSSGADADAVAIKDKNKLPYLPGKTIKGLFKDVLEDFRDLGQVDNSLIKAYFGEYNEKDKKSDSGSLYFSNATLSHTEQKEILKEMTEFLYHNITSTTINEAGVAKESSLRTMQVCVPVVLYGTIEGIKELDKAVFIKVFKYLRHIGSNRNRGLGRCKIEITN